MKNKAAKKKTIKMQEAKIIGWRERVALPDIGIAEMKAKIDTGARTSALHALDLRTELRDGEEWVSFHVPHLGEKRNVRHCAKVLDKRAIKNTSGIPQNRYVIGTNIVFGNRRWKIELSLTDRDKMKHDLILGRTAIRRHKILVEPGKSYLAGTPSPKLSLAL